MKIVVQNAAPKTISNPNSRIDWIDIAKGIGIIAMLIGHNIEPLKPIIYSFHVPLFFILCGFTFKRIDKGQFWKSTLKDFKRLIIPCIITRLIILVGNIILKDASLMHEVKTMVGSLAWGNHYGKLFGFSLPPIGRIWFLPALFITKFLYRISLNLFDDKSRLPIFAIMSFISLFLGSHNIILPQNLDMIFICLLFVEIGHLLKDFDFSKIKPWIFILLFSFWTYLSCAKNIYISMNRREYPGYGLCILVALAGCICIFIFSMAIEKIKLSKFLIFFGKNSLILLVVQSIAPYFFNGSNYTQKCIDMIVECLIVVAYVLAKSFIIKQKNKIMHHK